MSVVVNMLNKIIAKTVKQHVEAFRLSLLKIWVDIGRTATTCAAYRKVNRNTIPDPARQLREIRKATTG